MTTDYIQRNEAGRRLRFLLLPKALRKDKNAPNAPRLYKGGLELTRQENFVSGAQDIFDLLERGNQEKDGLKRTVSSAVNMLNNARHMIERAEKKIAQQNDHIEELKDVATTDALTGLMNRRGFFHAFIRELGRTSRGHNKGGLLILLDIDNLKNINHLYGQDAGDTCLKLVARALKNEIRAMDIGAFIGGDEFVLLFPNAEKEVALERAQKLALRLNNLSFIWSGIEISISASLGLKSYGPEDTAEDIFCQADKELHKSKKDKEKM
ncbi:MAG: hypothetical protein DHS20C02_17950 [Micavibrio sp.]|nr:MAG: hypothetical protein DHS20C02_17950 [Micavibrio sp.]